MLSAMTALLCNFFCLFLKVSQSDSYPPPLSRQEESECFARLKNGDESARGVLIEHNLRLVAHIVNKYYSLAKDRDDLISIGCIGLIKAVDSFDASNGTRFATYASKCLQNEILMHFRASKKLNNEVSVNEAIDTDKDGDALTYVDIISTPDTIADDIDRKTKSEKMIRIINEQLEERERKIIIMRYGLDGNVPITQKEAARRLGISRSYVSRIEKSSLEKIKELL